ncbi:acetyl-CoA carboxylase biotin carboxylase subunit [Thauera aromatica]|uniref:acetyl-CoA carboxylase biotin carboxylase subunit n=1 Tax=Thauera aromatica TaxID=59405 RepID=UPI001FFD4A93|nr:acetyl-CoA carboxylase biotin carboxylase subunit [Thauera aromatica]MCK2097426.1 acetyl-CoA carboxylase biotin carboxylase subunit [Thauera aromatica]
MFKKILIANRGEIACRVIKTARKMSIATVAVHSEADQDALFVELADEAVCIGPAPSKESYLVMDRIIAACRQTGAEAVHPGYGFLSENAEFSRRLEEEGIKFIGPKHYSVAKMGDKIESKKLAIEAGVNTIPGYNDAIAGPAEAVEIAKKIGYPVMIKASAGGGGKGLRVAFNDQEAFEGFSSCVNEAKASFGDDRVFIEKYVLEPRHIEIQVLGDAHGNYVYLNERDCSIQRRHQKVIEEAPSPFVDPGMRRAMGEQAVALARAVNYESAGTVEFVVSGATKEFYFLEMNTRLQVEHPVTELITGLDLVEQMIRVAAGEKLPITQADVRINGWAMECRINAEDPFRGFLPSTGRLVKFQAPQEVEGQVRVDTGVYEGGEISMYYDSMIAKLIVHGANREQAIERMRDALNAFVIRGISSNIPFQAALLQHPRFCSGHFNTGFIAEEYPRGFDASMVPHDDPVLLAAVATFARVRYIERATQIEGQLAGHGRKVSREWVVVMAGRQYPVSTRPLEGGLEVSHEGRTYAIVSAWTFGDLLFAGTVNGAPICLQIERRGLRYRIAHFGLQVEPMVMTPRAARLLALMPEKLPPDLSKFLLSPMPGLLREVAVAEGQEVKAGEKLATIEAMKMENVLKAEQDGKVKKIVARPGASLSVDEVIIEFE